MQLNIFYTGAVETDTDAEPGARLMCHLLLRLFCSSLAAGGAAVGSQPDEQKWMNILSSCDRHLLEAAHRGISVDPLVGVLKALLLIGTSENTQTLLFLIIDIHEKNK